MPAHLLSDQSALEYPEQVQRWSLECDECGTSESGTTNELNDSWQWQYAWKEDTGMVTDTEALCPECNPNHNPDTQDPDTDRTEKHPCQRSINEAMM